MKTELSETRKKRGDNFNMNISQKIEYIRQQKGILKSHIASKCGYKPSWYTDIANGKKRIAVDDLQKIADALGVNVTIFFEENLSETLKNYDRKKEVV